MVDRVYKTAIPEFRRALEELRQELSTARTSTDWVHLRVEPVLEHAARHERLLSSRKFSNEFSRLTKGVVLFHSDLVYLRTNVAELRKLVLAEKKRRESGSS